MEKSNDIKNARRVYKKGCKKCPMSEEL